MPNLILTYRCNNACPFCFNDNRELQSDLTLSAFEKMLPFIHSFKRDSINIVGGEPTLNPDFIPILTSLLDEDLRVTIFSNGRDSDSTSSLLQNTLQGNFSFCVNRTSPELTPDIIQFYQRLGYRIKLSLTFYEKNQKFDHIINEIIEYRLHKEVRIGIALPAGLKRQNVFWDPRDYHGLSQEVFDWIQKCVDADIRVIFDCGFTTCFFSHEQRDYFKEKQIEFVSNCGLIPDITPDGFIIPCFPLARFKQKISKTTEWSHAERGLNEVLAVEELDWFFPECRECPERRSGACSGGCRALRIK